MKTFVLNRLEDLSGISGTGIVAEGVEFSNGKISIMWNNTASWGLFDNMQQMLSVHGHNGKTEVVYV